MEKKYRFKIYYKDGSSEVVGGKANAPENLKYDFDCMISWEEYDRIINNQNLTAQDVVNLAKKIRNRISNDQIVKCEIINILTNEVIVSSN